MLGQLLSGDLQQYVQQVLYDGNPQLPPVMRDGLKPGDLKPLAPFMDQPPVTDPKAGDRRAAARCGCSATCEAVVDRGSA